MADFGDADPEDAWDAGDEPNTKALILARVLVSVAIERAGPHDHARTLARLAFAVAAVHQLLTLRLAHLEAVLTALLVGFELLQTEEGP